MKTLRALVLAGISIALISLPARGANIIRWRFSTFETSSDLSSVYLLLAREGDLSQAVSFGYTTLPGTALPGRDYFPTNGIVTFQPDSSGVLVQVPLHRKTVFAPVRTLQVALTNIATGWTLQGPAAVNLRILDAAVGFQFPGERGTKLYELSVSEGQPEALLYVQRGSGPPGEAWVDYEIQGGTALPGMDFEGTSGRLVFGAEDYSKPIRVKLIQNLTQESSAKTLSVRLTQSSEGTQLGELTQAKVTITDDDVGPFFQVIGESSRSQASIRVRVIRGQYPMTGTVEVDYQTAAGSATPGEDYVPVHGRLLFGTGEEIKIVEIPLIHDALNAGTEYFLFQLLRVGEGPEPINGGSGPVFIYGNDNDNGFGFEPRLLVLREQEPGEVTLRVHRSDSRETIQEVSFRTADGTAKAGRNYIAASGRLRFRPGQVVQTLTIRTLDDETFEANRSLGFSVELFDPSEGTLIGASSRQDLTILDDEQLVEVGSVAIEGAGAGSVLVTRHSHYSDPATIHVRVFPTPPANSPSVEDGHSGFSPAEGDVTFIRGQREALFFFPVLDNPLTQPWRMPSYQVEVSQMSGPSLPGLPKQISGTITEDDSGFQLAPRGTPEVRISRNAGRAQLEVERHGSDLGVGSVDYELVAANVQNSAQPGIDFVPTQGTLHFSPGQTKQSFFVDVSAKGSVAPLGNLMFNVQLSHPVGETPLAHQSPYEDNTQALYPVSIVDDESPANPSSIELVAPLQWMNAGSRYQGVMEKEGEVELELRRPWALDREEDFHVTLSQIAKCADCFGTSDLDPAIAGVDFEPADLSVHFAPGQRSVGFPIRLHADDQVEGMEEILVTVFGPNSLGAATTHYFHLFLHDVTGLAARIHPLGRGDISHDQLGVRERSFPDGGGLSVSLSQGAKQTREVIRFLSDGLAHPEFSSIALPALNAAPFNTPPFRDVMMAISRDRFWVMNHRLDPSGAYRLRRFDWLGKSDPNFTSSDLLLELPPGQFASEPFQVLWPESRILPIGDSAFYLIGPVRANGRLTPYGARISPGAQELDVFPQDARISEAAGSRTIGVLRYGDVSKAATYQWSLVDGTAIGGRDFVSAQGSVDFPPGESSARVPITMLHTPNAEPDRSFSLRFEKPGSHGASAEIEIVRVNEDLGILDVSIDGESRTSVRLFLAGHLSGGRPSGSVRLMSSADQRNWRQRILFQDSPGESGNINPETRIPIESQLQYFRLECVSP